MRTIDSTLLDPAIIGTGIPRSKPLDCTATVHRVESVPVTPPVFLTPEQHIQRIETALRCARINGGRMHLQEIEAALESLTVLRAGNPSDLGLNRSGKP